MLNHSGGKFLGEFLLRFWRFEVSRYFSKIWAVIYGRKIPKKRLYSLLFFQEKQVIAAESLRNAGNRHYFCTKYRRLRVFFSDPLLS